ncbi:MAG: glycosyltransferase family 4 protein, partial [Fulvivirga sp.]
LIVLRELFYLPSTIFSIAKIRRAHPDISIAHINDIQDFLSAFLIKKLLRIPVVIHIRGPLMRRHGFRHKFLMWALKNSVNQVIAIDETVRDSLGANVSVKVIHNGFIINDQPRRVKPPQQLVVGMVSSLLRFKGVLEFVEAARICKEQGLNIKFSILGGRENLGSNVIDKVLRFIGLQHEIEKDVLSRIERYNIQDIFSLYPFTEKIDNFYQTISVLCFPSHINAVGRPVFEAGFYRIPSIVAISNPKPDAITHMQTGLCIEEKNPENLASAIKYFYNNPSEIDRMGENANSLANKNYDIKKNAMKVLEVYSTLS